MSISFDSNDLFYIESNLIGERVSLFDLAVWKNGLAFKNIDFSTTGKPIIKIAELNNGISNNTAYTDREYSDEVSLSYGDLVFSWSGNPKTSIDIYKYNLPDGWLNQHIFKVTPSTRVDKDFLFYIMKYLKPNFTKIATNKQTTGLGHVTLSDIKRINLILPELHLQKQIACILTSIDNKIELDQQQNNNLGQQAQALFKSWFVDFEPFGGKMPDDWKVGKLGDFIEIKRGGSPRPIQEYLVPNGLNWLKISDATTETSPYILEIKEHIKPEGLNKTVFVKKGSLVLSNSATPGIPKFLDIDTCIHDGWLYFPNSLFSNEYLFLLFNHIRKDLISLGNGSVFTNLKTDILKNFEAILPTKEVLRRFDSIISSIFISIKYNREEIATLTTLRDMLLPKLMSGEIDVSNVDISALTSTDKLSFTGV